MVFNVGCVSSRDGSQAILFGFQADAPKTRSALSDFIFQPLELPAVNKGFSFLVEQEGWVGSEQEMFPVPF